MEQLHYRNLVGVAYTEEEVKEMAAEVSSCEDFPRLPSASLLLAWAPSPHTTLFCILNPQADNCHILILTPKSPRNSENAAADTLPQFLVPVCNVPECDVCNAAGGGGGRPQR